MANVTILAPHIDDESIGMGGSIAKHIDLGNAVRVIFFDSGRDGIEMKERESEAENVMAFLGIKDAQFLRGAIPYLHRSIPETIVGLLRQYSTDFLYAPHLNDGDSEHVTISELAHRLLWMANGNYFPDQKGKCNIKSLFLYEIHRPINEVHYLEDISSYEKRKKTAISMYKSQTGRVKYHKSAISLNRYRGISSEFSQCAEAFQIFGARNLIEIIGPAQLLTPGAPPANAHRSYQNRKKS